MPRGPGPNNSITHAANRLDGQRITLLGLEIRRYDRER